MPQQTGSYHHGDLRTACLLAAHDLLEQDGSAALSLRAVARRAGVSATAPYRHFADREALLSAVAAQGYRELGAHLHAAHPAPRTAEDLAAVAVAYVRFALARPALFRVMFAEPCDPADTERVAAAAVMREYVDTMVRGIFPGTDPEAMSTAVWALVHGLAFLQLDGKLGPTDPAEPTGPAAMEDRVRAAVLAVLQSAAETRR